MDTIRGFDASSGDVVATVSMAPGSQPGDLAFAKGKLYVAEEMGASPAIAIVDARTDEVLSRIAMPGGSRPHHVHASSGGNLVSVGLYGTDRVAVVDTATDELLGEWDTDPSSTANRAHAGVFSTDGRTLYVASDVTSKLIALDPRTGEIFWTATVPNAHELAVTHDGKTAYVSGRTAGTLRIVDLETHEVVGNVDIGTNTMPDTLQLSANEKLLTVGLRSMPAQIAMVDTATFDFTSGHDRRAGQRRRTPVDVAERTVHVRGARRHGRGHRGDRPRPGRRGRAATPLPGTAARRRPRPPVGHATRPERRRSGRVLLHARGRTAPC